MVQNITFEYFLNIGAFAPQFAHSSDVGADLFTPRSFSLYPNKRETIDTGVHVFCPAGFYAEIVPKSGLSDKYGISIVNSPGIIDSEYTGSLMVILINLGGFTHEFEVGDKIAQIIFKKKEKVELKQVYEIPITERGEGGLGSTGK